MAKMINVDELIEFCDTERSMLHAHNNSVTCAALRRVVEYAKEYAVEVEPVNIGWISVEDRLPEPETWVLAYIKYLSPVFEIERSIIKTSNIKKVFYDGKSFGCGSVTVTHWQPLPEPPKEE